MSEEHEDGCERMDPHLDVIAFVVVTALTEQSMLYHPINIQHVQHWIRVLC